MVQRWMAKMGSAAVIALLVAGCYVDPGPGGAGGGYATEAQPASGSGPASLRITNGSNESIMYIYMSPCSQSTWGPDRLGSNVLPRGSTLPIQVTEGCWDLRCVDSSQNYKEWRGQTFAAGGVYDLTVSSEGWTHD